MAHPFTKLFETALKKSSLAENFVLKEAEKLLQRGYPEEEICEVLGRLQKGLIDDTEAAIVADAREEVCGEE